MRRDQFEATVRADEEGPPILEITYEGPEESLDTRLMPMGEDLQATDIDASYRLFAHLDEDPDTEGVFSLTHRLTGEYLLEVNVPAGDVENAVSAARNIDEGPSYRVVVQSASGETDYELDTLLVYDPDGDLLRQHSLIPSGVEL